MKQDISYFFQDEDNGYLGYAQYVVGHRALPSIIDGLKPSHRKIIHAALSTMKDSTESKFLKLVGATLDKSAYAHGDVSLTGGIVTLAQYHTNLLHPLEIIGAGPELRASGHAAPRYLGIKLSKYAKLYRQDENILEHKIDDGQSIEPKYYLPLLPQILANRTSGMGLGFSFGNHVSYNPLDLIDGVLSHITTPKKPLPKLRPYINEFSGIFEYNEAEDRWWAEANWELKGDRIIVTELTPSQSYESFEAALDKAKDAGKILDWENLCEESQLKYEIIGNASDLKKLVENRGIWSHLKLGEYMKRPNLTMLNEDGKVTIFDDVEHVLRYFASFRLGMYDKLKSTKITDFNNRIARLSDLLKFIELYLDGKIKLDRNTPIAATIKVLDKHDLPHNVLDMQIKKLTKEEYDKLAAQKKDLEAQLKRLISTTTLELYQSDLKDLRTSIKSDFPEVNTYKVAPIEIA